MNSKFSCTTAELFTTISKLPVEEKRLFNNFIQSNISKVDVILKANVLWLCDANNKGAYQTARKHGLVCAFVVRIGCQDR